MLNLSKTTFMNAVIEATAKAGDVTKNQLIGKSRWEPLPELRYMAYTIIKDKNPKCTLKDIGEMFTRDHSSIVHGLKTFARLWQDGTELRQKYLTIKKSIYEPSTES